ncbi:uncharacterized protein LOC132708171 isoform X2 [Cylas formicarius]|nr:uncharacterized protein LOC132708171 isoform X2 [Cylas formicarius]
MVDGLPAIGVPQHNPIHVRNLSLPVDLGNVQFENNFTNIVWNNLPFFDIDQLTGISGGSEDSGIWAYFDWGIHWNDFIITGDFDWSVTGSDIEAQSGTASFSLTIENIHWSGIWNSTIADENHPRFVNNFTLNSKIDSSLAVVDGTPFDSQFAQAIQTLSDTLLNNLPATAVQALKDARFNGFWNDPDHPERVQAIIDHCNA